MTIFAYCATKGGDGKTTTAVQGVTGLAAMETGNRVLAIDTEKKQQSLIIKPGQNGFRHPRR